MKTLSLKLDEKVFGDTEKLIKQLKKSRNRYINDALDHYNKIQQRSFLKNKLKEESSIIKNESKRVLKDFESLEDSDD